MRVLALLLLLTASLEADIAQRVEAHLIIDDKEGAIEEAEQYLKQNLNHPDAHEAAIKALAAGRDFSKTMKAWQSYRDMFPEEHQHQQIAEILAWAAMREGAGSPAIVAQSYALIGALFSQDVQGVDILLEGLRSSNAAIRSITVRLVSRLRDERIQNEVIRLIENERNQQVRLEAIGAIGNMGANQVQNTLETIAADDQRHLSERLAATESLITLRDEVSLEEIKHFATSNRSGLRILACRLAAHFQVADAADTLRTLAQDSHASARQAALAGLGILRMEGPFSEALSDPDHNIAVTAAWALALQGDSSRLHQWIDHPDEEIRHLAAGALALTGSYGRSLSKKALNHTDPIVRLNAAWHLIGLRRSLGGAAHELHARVADASEKLMWQGSWPFSYLAPSNVPHHPYIPHHPETVDQLVRLELLNQLAIIDDPKALNALHDYLKAHAWGVTAEAAVTLLSEGDSSTISLIEELMQSSDAELKIQAALVLALWGRDPVARETLEQAYPTANRWLKERILEGLGRIGEKASIPFLTEKLEEPYLALRQIAASSIIQCVYR